MEPWLTGSIPGVDPVISHLLRATEHIRLDARKWLSGALSGSAAFHARHLAGSTERLTTYLRGRALTPEQLEAGQREQEPVGDAVSLIHAAFDEYDMTIRDLKPQHYSTLRHVGRQRIPVTAISLAIHIIEHGQRHLGQAIEAVKCSR